MLFNPFGIFRSDLDIQIWLISGTESINSEFWEKLTICMTVYVCVCACFVSVSYRLKGIKDDASVRSFEIFGGDAGRIVVGPVRGQLDSKINIYSLVLFL